MSEQGKNKEMELNFFISYLEGIRDDDRSIKVFAHLRRGLGKKMGTPDMYPYVVNFLPEYPREQEMYFLVASLFALHPDPAPRGRSIGETFRKVYTESRQSESIEKRFKALLAADLEDLGYKLRSVVSLAKSKGVSIDYHRLLRDIHNWDHPEGFVQMNWAKDFWGKKANNKKGE